MKIDLNTLTPEKVDELLWKEIQKKNDELSLLLTLVFHQQNILQSITEDIQKVIKRRDELKRETYQEIIYKGLKK